MPEFFTVGGLLASILAIVAGLIVLIWPHIISYIIGIYLLIIGIIGVINVVA
jgi:hypothetical protein